MRRKNIEKVFVCWTMKMWLSNHQGNQHFTLKLFTLTYMSVLRVFVILSCMCTFICVCCEYPKGLVIRTLTWPKRSAHICLVFFIVWLFPLSQSLYPFATMTLSSLSLPLSLSLSLSLIEHVDSPSNRLIPLFRVTQLIVFNLLL